MKLIKTKYIQEPHNLCNPVRLKVCINKFYTMVDIDYLVEFKYATN